MLPANAQVSFRTAILAAGIVVFSCAGVAKTAIEPPEEPFVALSSSPDSSTNPAATSFDPQSVTAAEKSATFVDVRSFIDSLNQIIRHKDFEEWASHLTDDYIRHYSDPVILAQYSEYPVIKAKDIKLLTLKDYFLNVVFPARQNDKIDDIEFVGEHQIKAITVNPKGERNILYMLEGHGDTWKIGIGR